MILIIDSGASNSSWKYIEENETFHLEKMKGFNLSTTALDELPIPEIASRNQKVSSIFFFGAGTGNPEKENQLKSKLKASFPLCQKYIIGSDLFSAALALSYGEEGIISILGTGSNCCHFDGKHIHEKINNLGYILGDEGSGFQMGKTILKDYFYHKMDNHTQDLFFKEYQLSRDQLIKKVYHENRKPNAYIASFASFLNKAPKSYRDTVSFQILSAFFEEQLTQLGRGKALKYHFSGSISWHFQDIIKKLCLKYDYKIGNIMQNPIASLSYLKLKQIQN